MRKFAGESFIRVDDVHAGPLPERIVGVRDGKFDRPDVIFESGEILSLNTTNTRTLMKAYGPDSNSWVDKDVELTLGSVEYQGKQQESVVVKPISPPIDRADRQAALAKLTAAATNKMNDKIPF
jgi:hypothetical protein